MLLLGIDLGTSSIKVSVLDAETQQSLASAQYPEEETTITSLQTGWAEQSPETWWQNIKEAIKKVNATRLFDPKNIAAIGIAYQMHGLVLVNKQQKVLRDSIIWCDSRAVETGNVAFKKIGEQRSLSALLNSPGNFTASKLSWVKENEPKIFESSYKMMLPGDFAAMKLTGEITTTSSALSEGIFWDFQEDELSKDVMNCFGFDEKIIPEVKPLFSSHGSLLSEVAKELSLNPGIPVSYKAGDQLNNALSLNVFQPGEVAATAGTSGVIYAITDGLFFDKLSRVNAFAHVNHSKKERRVGVLLCINGTGIMNRWIKDLSATNYNEMNRQASQIQPGSDGLSVLPFGNGAERIFENKMVGAHLLHIDLNKHSKAHLFRATQEGIVYSFRFGLDIMRENGILPSVIRVGKANMFLSDLFAASFVDATNVPVEMYDNDGSVGAALGAGIGAGIFSSPKEAFSNLKLIKRIDPSSNLKVYDELYGKWKQELMKFV
ncbi:MAG TPA: FGGY family carbohydrate kinase [Chitinophagaceae bacterium]|jgi:xylulokinase|nr:FGGY family carbohydrate kinase [Chitinophagaceae bacterium]